MGVNDCAEMLLSTHYDFLKRVGSMYLTGKCVLLVADKLIVLRAYCHGCV